MSKWMRPPGHSGSLVSWQVQKYLGTFACPLKVQGYQLAKIHCEALSQAAPNQSLFSQAGSLLPEALTIWTTPNRSSCFFLQKKTKQFPFWEWLFILSRILKTSSPRVTLMVRMPFIFVGIRVFLVRTVFLSSPPPSLQLYGCHLLRISPAGQKSLFDVAASWDLAALLMGFISLHCSPWVPCFQLPPAKDGNWPKS